jgi:hypothetical protein
MQKETLNSMRGRSTNAGETDNPFHVDKVAEMEAYDSLPPILRQALDTAAGEFSAAQAQEWIDGGRSAVEVAALIMRHSRDWIDTRMAECPPGKRKVR